MKLKKLFLLLFMSTALSMSMDSCTVTFVPGYDAGVIQQVTDGAQMTDALYLKMIASPNRDYTKFAADYAAVAAEINSIVLKEEVRPKGKQILQIAQILQEHFLKYEADHRARGRLTSGELQVYNDYLKAFWKPLLVAEMSLNKKK